MSTLKVNTLTNVAGNADIENVGKIVQYKYVNRTAVEFSTSSSGDVDVGGLTNTITLENSSNKVLIEVNLTPYLNGTTSDGRYGLKIHRDSSIIFHENYYIFRNGGYFKSVRPHIVYLDNPADTSSHTYKVSVTKQEGTATIYFFSNNNNSGNLVLMEVIA
jgi:hypothetical protein|tara:strand:+ start:22 stop:504 length:483 start_codon:yes stop_codon:yes gene_type:complete